MNVLTINPIIVNGKRESRADLYIPFDGKNASKESVLAFQKYANKSGYTPALKEDGIYGKNTQKAIDSGLGKKWDDLNALVSKTPDSTKEKPKKGKELLNKAVTGLEQAKESGLLDKIGGLFGLGATPAETPSVDTNAPVEESSSKLPYIIGGVVVLGIIVYFVTKKK